MYAIFITVIKNTHLRLDLNNLDSDDHFMYKVDKVLILVSVHEFLKKVLSVVKIC